MHARTLVACHWPSARWPFLCGCHTISWKVVLRSIGRDASVNLLGHTAHMSASQERPLMRRNMEDASPEALVAHAAWHTQLHNGHPQPERSWECELLSTR